MEDVSDVGCKPEHCTAFMYMYKFVSVCVCVLAGVDFVIRVCVCVCLCVCVCVCVFVYTVYHRLSYSLLRLREVFEQVVVEIKPNNKRCSIYKGYESGSPLSKNVRFGVHVCVWDTLLQPL